MPKISVVVPVYNVEKYLHECVDSILVQTFTDFELILINDGSLDQSGAICDEFACKDARVKVFHQENKGVAVTRNIGISKASGEWLMFVDSDDAIHPQMLELMYNATRKKDVRLVMCDLKVSHQLSHESWGSVSKQAETFLMNEDGFVRVLMNGKRYWIVCCKLVDMRIAKKIFFPEGRIYEDNATAFRWLQEAGEVADISEKLYFYRVTPNSIMNSTFSLKRLDYLWVLEQQIAFFEAQQYKRMLTYICSFYIKSAANIYTALLFELKNNAMAREVKRKVIRLHKKYRPYIELNKEERQECFRAFSTVVVVPRRCKKALCRWLGRM